MSKNNTNTTIDDEELIGKLPQYKGPRKLVWEDGRQVMRPDLDAISEGSSGSLQQQQQSSNFVGKTLDDVISETDEIQFSQLDNDNQKYDMIANLVSGVNHRSQLFQSRFVNGDPRDLKDILKDLIDQKKIYLNPKDGNIYEMQFALQEKMIKFPCRNCSKVLYSEEERRRHSFSHMIVQQQQQLS